MHLAFFYIKKITFVILVIVIKIIFSYYDATKGNHHTVIT